MDPVLGTPEEPEPDQRELVIAAGFDPAISKQDRAARSALVVAGQVRRGPNRGRIYVLETAAGHWSVLEQVKHLLDAVRRLNVRTVRIEDVAYQRALGDVLDREARLAGIVVNVELVRPDADKLRRPNAWSPLIEDGTVLFGAGQKQLIDAMLAVPGEPSQWDLVDAAGLCIRGFPKIPPESSRLPGTETSSATVAASYATRSASVEPREPILPVAASAPSRPKPFSRMTEASRRAAGYAVKPRSGR